MFNHATKFINFISEGNKKGVVSGVKLVRLINDKEEEKNIYIKSCKCSNKIDL